MRSAYYQPSSDRRRLVSLLLTIAAHILIILLLLRLAPAASPPLEPESMPVTFGLAPEPGAAPKASPKPAVAKAARAAGGAPAAAPSRVAPPTDLPPPPPTPPIELPSMIGGKELFDGVGAAMATRRADTGRGEGEGEGDDSGKDSSSTYGPGEGPGGQRLYNAEWYTRPPRGVLQSYLPRGAPPNSWGMIACQTIDDYRVDNCRFLGESPLGSGIGRAMREAAWQFRVRPPRIGGKKMVGAWVRIRMDFTDKAED